MNDIELRKGLLEEQKKLLEIKQQCQMNLRKAPKGKLRISHCKKNIQYYVRSETDTTDTNGEYISRENMNFVRALAQKDYDSKVMKRIEERIKIIDKLLNQWEKTNVEDVYDGLNVNRKLLVSPYIPPLERWVQEWNEQEYDRKTFPEGIAEIYTNHGERVRSKSEKIIADMLDKYQIPYLYERPIMIKGMGIIHPDFTCLNLAKRKEIVWEHLGMMDNSDYAEHALKRLELYQRNGYVLGENLIITYETARIQLETAMIKRNIANYLAK